VALAGALSVVLTVTAVVVLMDADPTRTPATAAAAPPRTEEPASASTTTADRHVVPKARVTKRPVKVIPGRVLHRKPPPGPVIEAASSGRVGTGLAIGAPSYVDAPTGQPAVGTVEAAVANLPDRVSSAGFARSMHALTASYPDFIMLNEVGGRSLAVIQALAPGYGAYRDPYGDPGIGGVQSLNNVVLWSAATWTLIDAGRVKLVDNDMGYYEGHPFTWDRYATWTTLQRADGGVVSVVSAHMMTNPGKYPRQPRRSPVSRVARYAHGMDVLRSTVAVLGQYGPVLVGGDMNSHPGQGLWTAAAKLGASGFRYTKDTGSMYLFYPGDEQLEGSHLLRVDSDHPALVAAVDLH
jgi:endonuclease/exonuclease/phosphatase (EEP) superfamily protein YafD